MTELVLSLFPGIDLLGRGFEAAGFCVVRGPDVLFGGDIRAFHAPAGHFTGVIGGPPCQDFSKARRTPATGHGRAMLAEFARVVTEARPEWFLMENVPCVPDLAVPGYTIQRIDLDARECGSPQRRARHFQFGSRAGLRITVPRHAVTGSGEPPCLASDGKLGAGRAWAEFCALQGLPPDFTLASFTKEGRFKAVGNGVPLPMSRALAVAIRGARPWHAERLCACGCGRAVTASRILATAACRKRTQRRRDAAPGVTHRVEQVALPL